MARSELTEVIRRVQGMIAYVTNNLSTDEYMLFLDLLVPEPEPEAIKPAKKKPRKPRGKSARATGMAAAIKDSLQRGQETKELPPQCAQELTNNGICAFPEDHLIHDSKGGYSGYHEFQPPVQVAVGGGG